MHERATEYGTYCMRLSVVGLAKLRVCPLVHMVAPGRAYESYGIRGARLRRDMSVLCIEISRFASPSGQVPRGRTVGTLVTKFLHGACLAYKLAMRRWRWLKWMPNNAAPAPGALPMPWGGLLSDARRSHKLVISGFPKKGYIPSLTVH